VSALDKIYLYYPMQNQKQSANTPAQNRTVGTGVPPEAVRYSRTAG